MQFLRMSTKDFRKLVPEKTSATNKYNAQKTVVDDVVYDSKWEAKKSVELSYLQKLGRIKDLERQKRFILQEGFVNNQGQKVRPISYIADFYYFDLSKKKYVVVDTKSPATRTPEYRIKKKLFEAKFKDILFIESYNTPV